jgi:hypothetical protein
MRKPKKPHINSYLSCRRILTKNIRDVEAETLENTFVLPRTFEANVYGCVD